MTTAQGRGCVILALVGVIAATPRRAPATDLTGTWRVEHAPNYVEYVDLLHQDPSVTGVFPNLIRPDFAGYGAWSFAGTFSDPALTGSLTFPSPPASGSLTASVFPGGDAFDGMLSISTGLGRLDYRTVASRCECFDGNTTNGDGCDARCRVEPCFTCTGMPSVCTPSPDGAACADGSPCTTGSTCSGGVCGGGTAVVPCVDFTGLWDTTQDTSAIVYHPSAIVPASPQRVRRAEHHGTVVLFRDVFDGHADFYGTIDLSTGAFAVGGGSIYAFQAVGGPLGQFQYQLCAGVSSLTGTLAADGGSFAATGTATSGCITGPVGLTGTRRHCGDGTLDPGEQCDDGNVVSGDGCDTNCTPTGCGNGVVTAPEQCDDGNTVSGDGCSATCTLERCGNRIVDVGEACDDGNQISGDGCDANCTLTACGNGVVTAGEECDDGNLASGDGCDATCHVEPCWACDGDAPSVCSVYRALVCSGPVTPGRARIQLVNGSGASGDSIAFRLSRNTGMPSADLGDPLTVTGWELCVIGGAPTSPALVFGARIPPAGTCGRGPCWRATRTGWAYADRAGSRAGIGYFQLTAGAAPTAGVTFRGRGGALASAVPVPAASLPLTVQVRSPGSGCYEATFGAVGVRRNDPANGRFVATGTP